MNYTPRAKDIIALQNRSQTIILFTGLTLSDEHISVLGQFEKTLNMYRKYYQFEEIKSALKEKLWKLFRRKQSERQSPMRLFIEHEMWIHISVWTEIYSEESDYWKYFFNCTL